jgi:hypothetical protein
MEAQGSLFTSSTPMPSCGGAAEPTARPSRTSDVTEIGAHWLRWLNEIFGVPAFGGPDIVGPPLDREVLWTVYALLRSHEDYDGFARVTPEQLAAESGRPVMQIQIALRDLADDECGAISAKWTREGIAYHACRSVCCGDEPIVEFPNSLLRDPTITPAAKRAAMGALLCGWKYLGRGEGGGLVFSIPNRDDASPDALIDEGAREL